MARGRVLGGSWLVGLGIGLGLVTAPLPRAVPDAGAAVLVCQNKKKTRLVALRADKCGKKENVAIDLTGVLGTQASTSADQGTRTDAARMDSGLACAGDPSRTFVESKFVGLTKDLGLVAQRRGGGCRTLDGNQAACVKAFQNNDIFDEDRREWPASSCLYFKGKCLPCNQKVAATAACTNSCVETAPKCADATRTVFLGGPDSDACQQPTTQADCEKAFHVGRLDPAHRVASCYWTGTACQGCGPSNASNGSCTNTCDSFTHASCKDPTRTTFTGGPDSDSTHRCSKFDANQAMCLTAYHQSGDGTAATCWYDTAATRCRGCGLRYEVVGKCTNMCL